MTAYVTVTLASTSWVPGSIGVEPTAAPGMALLAYGIGVGEPPSTIVCTPPSVSPAAAASASAFAFASATAAVSACE